jgi:hypothetical protein
MAKQPQPSAPPAGNGDWRPAWRRKEPRYLLSNEPPCRLVLGDPREAWWARVRDVSAGGVGLALVRQPLPGLSVTVEFRVAGGPPLVREACVVYAAPEPGPGWRAGCAFDRPLAAAELRALVEG